jgi:hypothetical protein
VEQRRFCSSCGQSLQPGAKFCANCGATVGAPQAATPPAAPAPVVTSSGGEAAVPSRRGRPIAEVIVIVLIVLAILGGAAYWYLQNRANEILQETGDRLASINGQPTATANVVDESGVISFGTGYDPETLQIRGEKTRFRVNEKIAWSASLSEAIGATTIELAISKRSAGGSERSLYNVDVDVSNPDFDVVANKLALGTILEGPGTYVMRYINTDGEVLAEGTFRLVR